MTIDYLITKIKSFEESPHVKLAQKEKHVVEYLENRLRQLEQLEKKGRLMAEAGFTIDWLNSLAVSNHDIEGC